MQLPPLSPVLPGRPRSLPLHGADASRAAEQLASPQLPAHTLMQRAGRACARLALALWPHAHRVWVACGPGNNGGDGMVAAEWLHGAGKAVVVTLFGDAGHLPPDAQDAWERLTASGVAILPPDAAAPEHDLAIDGLLGIGARRPPQGAMAAAIDALNASSAPVLSIDLPSGLHPDTGQPLDGAVVHADHTLSLLTLKPGLFTGSGRDFAGRVWVDGLDSPLPESALRLAGMDVLDPWLAVRRHARHKGSFGDVLVVGGAPGMSGAALLCGTAALTAGAGRVYVDSLAADERHPAGDAGLMWRPQMATRVDALSRCTVVAGCGGGPAIAASMPGLIEHAARLVLDADALNVLSQDAALRERLRHRGSSGLPTLLTPHPLEAARLLQVELAQVQHDRVAAARQLAERLQCVVLLKGSGSVCALPGDAATTAWINPTGNALLASAGTGDVLAGWIGGLWAVVAGSGGASGPLQAALAGAWLHGLAADHAAQTGRRTPLLASALICAMARRLDDLPGPRE